jgi:hypothetical protein
MLSAISTGASASSVTGKALSCKGVIGGSCRGHEAKNSYSNLDLSSAAISRGDLWTFTVTAR